MDRGPRVIAIVGPLRIITAVGGLLVLVGAGRSILRVSAGVPLLAAVDELALIGGPGLGLLYGRYWLARSDIHPEAYARIAASCLGGVGVTLLVLVLIEINPVGGIDQPFLTPFIAAALGSVAGFGIGVYEARAVSRAREAERHRDKFRTERDLRERIFETSPIGIAVVGADRSIRKVNERAADIVGLPREDLLEYEYDESMFGATEGDGDPISESIFQQVLTTGTPVYDTERRIRRPDGKRIWLSVSGAPLHDPDEEISGVIFAFEDTTELNETMTQLEQSNDRLRQFAYAASHDLQEPLRMISTYLQLLETRYRDDLDEDAQEYIDFAVDSSDRMRQMVDDLLEYSRLEQQEPEFGPVECDVVVERSLTDLRVHIEERGAEIDTEPLPTVRADENQLEKLFQNLISNAIKYNTEERPRVEIGAEQRDGEWVFSVVDNGIGIQPDYTDQIFEVFNRLHSNTEEYSGTGVGLSVSQKIVEYHGGRIWVESDPSEGSTFFFTLPVAEHPPSQMSA